MSSTMQARRYGFETARPKSPPAGARAIGGVRVSAVGERDGETATSAPDQREWAAWECERRGWELVRSCEDMSVPGDAWDERLGLWQAVEAIEDGRAEVLLFQNTKRLARDVELGFHVRRRIENAGGWLVLGDVPDGAPAAMVGLMLGQGQDDHDEKKSYLRAAKIAATGKGVKLGKVPFGYRRGEGGVLEPVEGEAAVVVALFEARARGASWSELAALFHAGTGKRRAQASLSHLIGNRTYLGEVWFEDQTIEGAHPAIVSPELFTAANARRTGRPPRTGESVKALLSGIARCGTCGYGLTAVMAGSVGYQRRYYKCVQGRVAGACSAPVMANAEKVDELVLADVWDWLEGRGETGRVYVSAAGEAELVRARVELAAAEADAIAWASELSIGLPAAAVRAGSEARAALVEQRRAEVERLEAAHAFGAARITLRELWPTLNRDELRYLLTEIGLLVRISRAPRGTELRARVETIIGGAFNPPLEDGVNGAT